MSLFGGAQERLAFLLDLDSSRAISEAKKTGDTLERELGRGDKAAQNVGVQFQRVGLGMVAFGGLALKGLGDFAKAGEEATQSSLKLSASVEKAGAKAGGSVEPFQKLAEEMSKKTEFDHVAVQNSEAFQLQIGETQNQVLQLTPLIADLAAKEGIDLATATDKVTKAVNGKKKGLESLIGPLDATVYKTDKYAAVQDALNKKVGGFADEQGKTFSGQMAILGNQLHDLEEGVGQGAVKAFSAMFGAVSDVTGALNSINPGIQSGIGEVATFAATGLVAAGALSAVAGTVMKAKENLGGLADMLHITKAAKEEQIVVDEALTTSETELAVAEDAAALGPVALVAGVVAVGAAMVVATQNSTSFSTGIKSAGEVAQMTDQNLRQLIGAAKLTDTSMYDIGKTMAKDSIPAAEAFANRLDAMGQSSVDVRRAIDDQKKATADSTAAQQENTQATQAAADAEQAANIVGHETTMTTQEIKDAQKQLHDQLKTTTTAYAEQYNQLNKNRDLDLDVRDKVANLTTQIAQNGSTLDINTQKGRDNIRALEDTGKSIAAVVQKRLDETGSVTEANKAGDLYKINLAQQLTQAGLTQQQVQTYLDTLNLTPVTKNTAITLDANQAFEQLHALDALIAGIDPSVDLQVRLGRGARAQGGDVTDSVTEVGEQGRELLKKNDRGGVTVIPSGAYPSTRSSSSGRTVIDNVIVVDGRVLAQQRRTFDRRH